MPAKILSANALKNVTRQYYEILPVKILVAIFVCAGHRLMRVKISRDKNFVYVCTGNNARKNVTRQNYKILPVKIYTVNFVCV